MPTYPHIERYYTELNDIIQFRGSDNESSIRAAFQNWLSEYCANHRENLWQPVADAEVSNTEYQPRIADKLRPQQGAIASRLKKLGLIED